MKSLKHFLFEARRSYTAYHNTDKRSYANIISSGFRIDTKTKRKKLFGQGIYFSREPNPRWGDHQVEVKLTPKNPLIDPNGDIIYEDNELGKEIQEIGATLHRNFKITNSTQLADAIEAYLKQHRYDMLITEEYDRTIYVVRDPSIIEIV